MSLKEEELVALLDHVALMISTHFIIIHCDKSDKEEEQLRTDIDKNKQRIINLIAFGEKG